MHEVASIDQPLIGREALRYVDREFKQNGSTIYFLSFVNKVPKPKETFASYCRFVNNSQRRLQKLAEYSNYLHSIALQKRLAAQRLVLDGKLDNSTIQQLFSQLPVRQIIPRTRKYYEVKKAMFTKHEDHSKEIHRLLAAIISQPLICR